MTWDDFHMEACDGSEGPDLSNMIKWQSTLDSTYSCFPFRIFRIWNKLPVDIVLDPNIFAFSGRFKHSTLTKSLSLCLISSAYLIVMIATTFYCFCAVSAVYFAYQIKISQRRQILLPSAHIEF